MGAANWFRVREVEQGIFVLREHEHVQSYLVRGEGRSALIDTGMGFRDIREAARALVSHEIVALNTHWHFDHIGGNALFRQVGIARCEASLIEPPISNAVLLDLYVRPFLAAGAVFPPGFAAERYEIRGSRASLFLDEGDIIPLGGRSLKVLATPGHTRGSLSFLDSLTGALFCGDLLYPGTLYAHFDDSDVGEYAASLERLAGLGNGVSSIYGGHNAPRLPEGLLEAAWDGFRRVRAGTPPVEITGQWGEPAHVYQFGQIRILARAPGSQGVHLARRLHGGRWEGQARGD